MRNAAHLSGCEKAQRCEEDVRGAAHPAGGARCGPSAGCWAIEHQSLAAGERSISSSHSLSGSRDTSMHRRVYICLYTDMDVFICIKIYTYMCIHI